MGRRSEKSEIQKDQNPEVTCWSLDFARASGEVLVLVRMRILRDIDIAVHELDSSLKKWKAGRNTF